MDYTYADVAKMIDHSLLNPVLTVEELEQGCRVAASGRGWSARGWTRAGESGLRNEWGLDDVFMVLELEDGALPDAGGVVKYASEFSAVA